MPPKKLVQPLLGQKKFSFRGQPLHTASNDDKPESDSVTGSASSPSNVVVASDNDSERQKKEIPAAVVQDLWLAEI